MRTNSVKNKLRTLTFARRVAAMLRSGILAYLIGIALLSGTVHAQERIEVPSVPIPNTPPNVRPAPAPLTGMLYRPANTRGSLPVVIVLHTCGGISSTLETDWAARLNNWGYAAFVLDSFTARGVKNVCAPEDKDKATPLDRAGDAINAAHVLAQIPGIDGKRIGAVGMSHGGATAVTISRRMFEEPAPNPIRAVVAIYGSCVGPQFHGTVPLLALAGEADDWGFPAKTCAEFQKALRPDQPMELHTYPGVYHSFDNQWNMSGRIYQGHKLLYDQPAAEDAFARTHAFFDKYLRDAK